MMRPNVEGMREIGKRMLPERDYEILRGGGGVKIVGGWDENLEKEKNPLEHVSFLIDKKWKTFSSENTHFSIDQASNFRLSLLFQTMFSVES